jgi:hypothetical protein
MNYTNIDNLVRKYKRTRKPSTKNKLFLAILEEYGRLITKICSNCYDFNEAKSIFIHQLLNCIDKFNINNGASFNTFAYPWLCSIRRQSIEQTGYFKYKINTCSEFSSDDFEMEEDFMMDLKKILTPEEMLAYKLSFTKNNCNNRLLLSAKSKIMEYLYN